VACRSWRTWRPFCWTCRAGPRYDRGMARGPRDENHNPNLGSSRSVLDQGRRDNQRGVAERGIGADAVRGIEENKSVTPPRRTLSSNGKWIVTRSVLCVETPSAAGAAPCSECLKCLVDRISMESACVAAGGGARCACTSLYPPRVGLSSPQTPHGNRKILGRRSPMTSSGDARSPTALGVVSIACQRATRRAATFPVTMRVTLQRATRAVSSSLW